MGDTGWCPWQPRPRTNRALWVSVFVFVCVHVYVIVYAYVCVLCEMGRSYFVVIENDQRVTRE